MIEPVRGEVGMWKLTDMLNAHYRETRSGFHRREFRLSEPAVRHSMSDMKTLTMRDLNRKTASVLDALERGETFELHRNGRAVGYLTQTPPPPERKPDWKAHFEWLRKQKHKGGGFVEELEEDRRRLRAREIALGNLT